MSEETKQEQGWVWKINTPLERFHGPVEMFWRGLGYEVEWHDHELKGSREVDGQERTFRARLSHPSTGRVEIRCEIEFAGTVRTPRPGDPTHPRELGAMLGRALSRGFGPPEDASANPPG